jgi:hypothetical protein
VAPIVATAGVLLLQIPPVVASVSVIVVPGQSADGPTIIAGNGFTLIITLSFIIRLQPVALLVACTL